MAAGLYAPQGVELVLERTGPITGEKIDVKRIEILYNIVLYKYTQYNTIQYNTIQYKI